MFVILHNLKRKKLWKTQKNGLSAILLLHAILMRAIIITQDITGNSTQINTHSERVKATIRGLL